MLEQRPRLFPGRLRPRDHQGQRALARTLDAPGHRGFERGDAALGRDPPASRIATSGPRSTGRRTPRSRSARDQPRACRAPFDATISGLGRLRNTIGAASATARALGAMLAPCGGEGRARRLAQVVGHHAVPGRDETPRHGTAHAAQSDETAFAHAAAPRQRRADRDARRPGPPPRPGSAPAQQDRARG